MQQVKISIAVDYSTLKAFKSMSETTKFVAECATCQTNAKFGQLTC